MAPREGEVQTEIVGSLSGSPAPPLEQDRAVSGHVVQAVLSMLWSTVAMELWKRRSSAQSYRWGTLLLAERFAEPRPGFQGEVGVNPVTGRVEPLFPEWRRGLIIGLVSVPVVGLFLGTRAGPAPISGAAALPPQRRPVSLRRAGGGGHALLLLGGGPGAGAPQRLGLGVVPHVPLRAFRPPHRLHQHAGDGLQDGGSGFNGIR